MRGPAFSHATKDAAAGLLAGIESYFWWMQTDLGLAISMIVRQRPFRAVMAITEFSWRGTPMDHPQPVQGSRARLPHRGAMFAVIIGYSLSLIAILSLIVSHFAWVKGSFLRVSWSVSVSRTSLLYHLA